MKIPHLYRVWNEETGEAWELFAKDDREAICKCPESASPLRTEELLTTEGYRITMLRFLPAGTYFNLVAARGKKSTPKRVYVRGEYDRPEAKYECCYFEDINHWRLLNGRLLVTTDATF